MVHLHRRPEVQILFDSLNEFILCWQSKQRASFSFDCDKGQTSIKFSCNLGYPGACDAEPKKARKTPCRIKRDRARAAKFQKLSELDQSSTPSPPVAKPAGAESLRKSAQEASPCLSASQQNSKKQIEIYNNDDVDETENVIEDVDENEGDYKTGGYEDSHEDEYGEDEGEKVNEKVEDEEYYENDDEDHGHDKDEIDASKDISEPTVRDVMNALIDFGTGIDHKITQTWSAITASSKELTKNLVELKVDYGRIKEHCSSLEERIAYPYLERYLH